MPGLLWDTDQPTKLTGGFANGCRVATYADLLTPTLAHLFAGRLVVIDRGLGDPMNLADVADIEPGALTVDEGAAKIRQWVHENRPFPTAYHNRDIWAAVDAALTGVAFWNWVATLDGTLLPDGRHPAAVQFAGAGAVGEHADLSIVWDDQWHPLPSANLAGLQAKLKADIMTVDQALGVLDNTVNSM